MLTLALIAGLWSSCAVDQALLESSRIRADFALSSPAAMDGKITIQEAYLKLDHIDVNGSLSEQNIAHLTHPVPPEEPPFKLRESDSSYVDFSVPSSAYDRLDLHLFLVMDDYTLVWLNDATGEPETPPANGNPPPENNPPPEDNNTGEAGMDEGDTDSAGNTGDDDEDQDSDSDEDQESDNDDDEGKDPENDDDTTDENTDAGEDAEEDAGDNDDAVNDDNKQHNDDKETNKKDKKKKKEKHKNKGHDDDDDDDDHSDGDEDDDDEDKRDDDGRKSSDAETRTVDLDHFFQNARPGLLVSGLYENNGRVIQLIFAATDLEQISVRGKQNDNFSIVLTGQHAALATFDVAKWFESLTPADIESGDMQDYQQQKVLFIHPEFNTILYRALISALEKSVDLSFSSSAVGNL